MPNDITTDYSSSSLFIFKYSFLNSQWGQEHGRLGGLLLKCRNRSGGTLTQSDVLGYPAVVIDWGAGATNGITERDYPPILLASASATPGNGQKPLGIIGYGQTVILDDETFDVQIFGKHGFARLIGNDDGGNTDRDMATGDPIYVSGVTTTGQLTGPSAAGVDDLPTSLGNYIGIGTSPITTAQIIGAVMINDPMGYAKL